MALTRCIHHHAWPKGRGNNNYIGYVKPIGYPETALICGRCDKPGVIWLTAAEKKEYEKGVRVFKGPSNFTQMMANNDGFQAHSSIDCPNCRFSLQKLKQMQEKREAFYTIARQKKLLTVDVDERSEKIVMKRSTGKNTWPLDYQKLKHVHDLLHQGELTLHQYDAIGREVPTWGTYIGALLKHLGTEKTT